MYLVLKDALNVHLRIPAKLVWMDTSLKTTNVQNVYLDVKHVIILLNVKTALALIILMIRPANNALMIAKNVQMMKIVQLVLVDIY